MLPGRLWLLQLRRLSSSIRSNNADLTPKQAAEYLAKFEGGEVTLKSYGEKFPGIMNIIINNPAKKNGLTGKMMSDLHQIMDQLESEQQKYRAIVLQGTQKTFCSGGDLDFVKQVCTPDAGYAMCTLMSDTLRRLSELPIISIAKIEGFALGGAAELVSACDVRVCHTSAKVGFVQGRIGVSPGWGGLTFITRILGYSRALEALATAKVMTADELGALQFIQKIYASDEDFEEYLKQYLAIDIEPMKAMKKGLVALHTHNSTAFQEERRIFTTLWGGDLQKALLATNRKHK